MNDITLDHLVSVDRKMTAKMSELQKELDAVEADRETVRLTIADMMKEQGVESVRTKHGTVTRVLKERYWASDWAVLHQYILEHGAIDLLEKRVAQTNMREWIENHREDFPPALNVDRTYSISIRKPPKGAGDE
mgnify:FL=1